MGTQVDKCPACKYDLRGLDEPRDCPECGHFIRGPLPRGKFRLPVVSRVVAYAAIALLVPANLLINHGHSRGLGEVLLGAAGLASMMSLVGAAVGLVKQRARPKEPSYFWTIAFGILGLIGTAASQPL